MKMKIHYSFVIEPFLRFKLILNYFNRKNQRKLIDQIAEASESVERDYDLSAMSSTVNDPNHIFL